MRVAMRKDDDVAGHQAHRLPVGHLDEAFAFGDQVKDHDAFGTGFEQRSGGVGRWRLIAPGRREARLDEDRAHEVHDAKDLRERVHRQWSRHHASSMSIRTSTVLGCATACEMGAQRRPSSTSARSRVDATPGCRDAHRDAQAGRPNGDRVAIGIHHPEQAARVRSAVGTHFERGECDSVGRRLHRDRGRGACRQPGAEHPARRDPVAGAAEFGRHVGRHHRPVGMARDDPRAVLPSCDGERVVVHPHVGPSLEYGRRAPHRGRHLVHRHVASPAIAQDWIVVASDAKTKGSGAVRTIGQ